MFAATKLIIITERILLDKITALVEEMGATGYTYSAVGGKGSRGKRTQSRAHVSGLQANVKIEVVVSGHDVAEQIAEALAARFFEHYSGIVYVEAVEILRPAKFRVE